MHTFYYADHIHHDPIQLQQIGITNPNLFVEVPQRAQAIMQAIKTAQFGPIIAPGDFGLEPIGEIHDYALISLLQNGSRLWRETSSPANAPYDRLIPDTFCVRSHAAHTPRSLQGLLGYYTFDIYSPILEHTWNTAYWAAQTAVSAAALVLAGSEKVAYALCRPPGHHAAADLIGGYCYLNNAAIAANWLVQQGQRVAIIDIDYHHGNGTQAIFYGRSDVFVSSLHADPFNEYPYYWGYADEFGDGPGRNHNFNYPLPHHTQETQYLQTLDEALRKTNLYVPDTLIISLGLDILSGDPVGGFRLEIDSLAAIGTRFAATGLPLVVIQEGGYQLDKLSAGITAFFRGLLQS